jgi:acetyl esterase/lipase
LPQVLQTGWFGAQALRSWLRYHPSEMSSKLLCLLLTAVLVGSLPGSAQQASRKKQTAAQAIAPDYADVRYGPAERNRFDLWKAPGVANAPLAVFIHGGGFVGGDKSVLNPGVLRKMLDAKVSVAAVNYRFLKDAPIQSILRDCARAVQFLRANAKQYGIDKQRVAAFGGSAGAGTSLWLAFHDDLAEPGSPDPVLRESSRLVAAASTAGQATYDITRWKEFLGEEAMTRHSKPTDLPAFFGLASIAEMESPAGQKIRADVDMLALISTGDAPVYLVASSRHDGLTNRGDVNHTAKHSRMVKQQCEAKGVKAVVEITDGEANRAAGHVDFLIEHLRNGNAAYQ